MTSLRNQWRIYSEAQMGMAILLELTEQILSWQVLSSENDKKQRPRKKEKLFLNQEISAIPILSYRERFGLGVQIVNNLTVPIDSAFPAGSRHSDNYLHFSPFSTTISSPNLR